MTLELRKASIWYSPKYTRKNWPLKPDQSEVLVVEHLSPEHMMLCAAKNSPYTSDLGASFSYWQGSATVNDLLWAFIYLTTEAEINPNHVLTEFGKIKEFCDWISKYNPSIRMEDFREHYRRRTA